jgi:hypothetical protein
MTPATKIIPPRTKYTMSVTQAKTFPDKIVLRQEENAERVTRGPKITIPIPIKKTTGRIGRRHSVTVLTGLSWSRLSKPPLPDFQLEGKRKLCVAVY